jgi:hypothetical protein
MPRLLHLNGPVGEVQAVLRTGLVDAGPDLVERIRKHLAEHLAGRPDALRVETTGIGEEEAYRRLLDVLGESRGR